METKVDRGAPLSKLSSYRTYEEWKLVTISVALNTGKSSYRTYEEWKPSR